MTAAQRIDEMVKEQYYHYPDGVGHDQHSMLLDYIRKDGVKALPALTDIANNHDPDDPSGYEFQSIFVAFITARDIDNVVIRIRGTKEGHSTIKAFEGVLKRMKKAGYADKNHKSQRRYVMFLENLSEFQGKVPNLEDGTIRTTLGVKHNIQVSREEMIRFSDYLTSLDPTYPSRCRHTSLPNPSVCKESKEYYDAYLRFKAEVAFSGFCSNVPNISEFNELYKLSNFPKLESELHKRTFNSFSDKIQVNVYLIGELCQDVGYLFNEYSELLVSRGEKIVGAISSRMAEVKNWNALYSLSELLVEIDADCECLDNNPLLLSALKKVFDHPPKIDDQVDKYNFEEFRSNISRLNIDDSLIKSKLVAK